MIKMWQAASLFYHMSSVYH